MANYLVAEGHDVALVSLALVEPTCRSEGLRYGRSTFTAGGGVVREAPWIELVWDVFEDDAEYNALLALFGLDALSSANVTVYVPGPLHTFVRYNGRAIRPATGDGVRHQNYFLRDVTILIKDLVAAS